MWGNGDSTLITTPSGKNILIDTGEQDNTIVEYLLDRKIKTIDYMLISHFDSDHSGKAVEIIGKLNVKNIIVSMQSEPSYEFEKVLQMVRKKNVNIIQVEAGDAVKVDKDIYFKILWPETEETIKENPLNNNSIVMKMVYKDFSMLFTGDIEEEAEKSIVSKYPEEVLTSTVLKVSHHGSNTSSTEEFIRKVKPKISLIGVGKDNNFGHPSESVIERLNNYGSKIYRTDSHGGIMLEVNKKGEIKVSTHISENV